MNTREIEILLEKFYDGNTSLEEEKSLRDFFDRPDIPPQLSQHAELFRFFLKEQEVVPGKSFDLKLDKLLEAREEETRVVPMNGDRWRFLYFTGIAASILLAIGLSDLFRSGALSVNGPDKTPTRTELAYAETKEALKILSENFNYGLNETAKLEVIDKAMKPMQAFRKFYQYESLIINPEALNNASKKR